MNYKLLEFLKCPVTKKKLEFKLISEFDKIYIQQSVREIKDGLLFSESGFIFPIIDGIPRMLVEAIYDYAEWLREHLNNYEIVVSTIEQKHPGLLDYCIKKNHRTKKSFQFEWSLLNYSEKDKIWHKNINELSSVFCEEANETTGDLKTKKIIDIGCGHGLVSNSIGKYSSCVIGAELSLSVEGAYKNNEHSNVWFLQADLEFLPFSESTFDIAFSSGVLHHTKNTEASLSSVEPVLQSGGKLSIWLYHPRKDMFHTIMLFFRNITKKMPVRILHFLLLLFVFPVTFTIKKIKGMDITYREEMIDLIDGFSPEFRFEHSQGEVISWLTRRRYHAIKITSVNKFGFSVAAVKS